MSKVLVSDGNLTNIANSIRSKLNVSTTYKPSQMSAAIDGIQTGLDINGVIQNYFVAAGNSVSAGDFVKYAGSLYATSTDRRINSTYTADTNMRISVIKLTENKVFIAFTGGTTSSGNECLRAIVCTISGTTITLGSVKTLVSSTESGYAIKGVALAEDKVFIAHSVNNSSNNSILNGIVCTISGTTITAGTDVNISTNTFNAGNMAVAMLTSSKVFLTYVSSYYLRCVVCTISGTTITVGTEITVNEITANSGTSAGVAIAALSSSKVFIGFSNNYNYIFLSAVVCTISGTAITAGSVYQTSTSYGEWNYSGIVGSAVALDSSRVLVAHPGSGYGLTVTLFSVNGTTISYVAKQSVGSGSGVRASMVKIGDNEVFIAHRSDTSSSPYLKGIACTISGSTIIQNSDVTLVSTTYSGYMPSVVALNDNKVFIGHPSDSNYYLNGLICEKGDVATVSSSTDAIVGVANNSVSGGQTVEVYVPQT